MQRIQHQSGALVVEPVVQDGVDHLHHGHLHRIGVFQRRQVKRHDTGFHAVGHRLGMNTFGAQTAADVGQMEIAVVAAAQCRRPAELAVGLDMFALPRLPGVDDLHLANQAAPLFGIHVWNFR